jgi:hypothetical protein
MATFKCCASIGLLLLHELTFCTFRPASKEGVLPSGKTAADRRFGTVINQNLRPQLVRKTFVG